MVKESDRDRIKKMRVKKNIVLSQTSPPKQPIREQIKVVKKKNVSSIKKRKAQQEHLSYPNKPYKTSQLKKEKQRRPSHTNKKIMKREPPRPQAPQQKSAFLHVLGLVLNLFYYVFVIGLIIGSTMFAYSGNDKKSMFGYRYYNVLTNSMVPTKETVKKGGGFRAGDIVIVKMVDGETSQKDDIVVYPIGDGKRNLTHRVVKTMSELNGKKGKYLVTRGDANNADDPPFEAKRVIGKVVFSIPQAGAIVAFVRGHFWTCLIFIASLLGFFLVMRHYFFEEDVKTNK